MLSFRTWKYDFQSSLVVFLIALPLCLGIALASNAPMAAGLYGGIIGGLVVGFLSGSPISVSGPAAGLAVTVAVAIRELGHFEAFTLAVFLSGLIQILFGFLKGGRIGNYFPNSVVRGMLAAIGMILILKQLPHAVGYDADFMGDQSFAESGGINTFTRLILALQRIHPGAALIAFFSLGILLLWEKGHKSGKTFFKMVPGALVAVVVAIILNQIFQAIPSLHVSGEHLVSLPFDGGLKEFMSGFRTPDWSSLTNPLLYKAAFTIAIVGSLETLLAMDAADKINYSSKISNKSRELFAQGVGNTLSGLIGGLPMTSVIVRTSANVSAGARSKLSVMLQGLWLALFVIFIPGLLKLIPISALAAILLVVGYQLTRPQLIKEMYAKGMNQFIPFSITIISILLTDLMTGIMIGLVVGFIFVIKSNLHKSIVCVSDQNMYLIRFHKDVSFLQKTTLTKMLYSIPAKAYVVIDGSYSVFIDDDILEVIEDFMKRAKNSDITVELKRSTLALTPMFKEI